MALAVHGENPFQRVRNSCRDAVDRTGLARRVTFEGALFAADEREAAVVWVAGSMVLVTFEGALFAADEREDAVGWASSMVFVTFEGTLFAADQREDAVVWVAGSMVLAT